MKNILKSIAATLVLGASFTCLKPLSETTAKVIAVAGGGLAGVGAGLATYSSFVPNTQDINKKLVTGLIGTGTGALAWWALDSILYGLTPPGRVLYAAKTIQHIKTDLFIASDPQNEAELITRATRHFGGSWPVIKARKHLLNLLAQLDYTQNSLLTAFSEASEKSQYTALCKRCEELSALIMPLKNRIENILNILINSKDYKFQVSLYEKHLASERQRTHEARLKQKDRQHDSRERKKDRKHKEKLLSRINRRGRPTSMSVSI